MLVYAFFLFLSLFLPLSGLGVVLALLYVYTGPRMGRTNERSRCRHSCRGGGKRTSSRSIDCCAPADSNPSFTAVRNRMTTTKSGNERRNEKKTHTPPPKNVGLTLYAHPFSSLYSMSRSYRVLLFFFYHRINKRSCAFYRLFKISTVNVWFGLVSLLCVIILMQYLDIRELYKLTSDMRDWNTHLSDEMYRAGQTGSELFAHSNATTHHHLRLL